MIKDILKSTNHREYPIPAGHWLMMQKWEHLLFISWPVPLEIMKELIPPGLDIDTFYGKAWISVIPFKVSKIRLRKLPSIPYLRSYLELNVRTYVKRKGVSGVYFLRLDVNNLFTVFGARLATLPYFHAQMKLNNQDNAYHFSSSSTGKEQVKLKGNYRPNGKTFYPEKGSHSYWLLERYFSWTYKGAMLFRSELHHKQWEVQDAELCLEELSLPMVPNTLLRNEPVLYYAREKVALNWMIQKEK